MDLIPIIAIVFGNVMIISVTGVIAGMINKTKKYKHELAMKKAETAGGGSQKIEGLISRIESLETLSQEQDTEIKQLKDENKFFHRLLEDKT